MANVRCYYRFVRRQGWCRESARGLVWAHIGDGSMPMRATLIRLAARKGGE